MSYYSLPEVSRYLDVSNFTMTVNKESQPKINHSLYEYLRKIKNEIHKYKNMWDTVKKITNPYEYIHSSGSAIKTPISQLHPLSRSFYKMTEIINVFGLIGTDAPIRTFHIAEGPGGFIEAVALRRNNMRFDNKDRDVYYGMTLIDDDNDTVPGWRKTRDFLEANKNVYIERGADNTGNILSVENYVGCLKKFLGMSIDGAEQTLSYGMAGLPNGAFDLITADGGFDFSADYNGQEEMANNLILTEIIYALSMQKLGGDFVLKVYDIFFQCSIDNIYLLSCFYKRVSIYKPNTSRYANSERYVVCQGLKCRPNVAIISYVFQRMIATMSQPNMRLSNIFNINIPMFYVNALENLNATFGEQQLLTISNTISLIDNFKGKREKVEQIKGQNMMKCVRWCELNNVPCVKRGNSPNIFLTSPHNSLSNSTYTSIYAESRVPPNID